MNEWMNDYMLLCASYLVCSDEEQLDPALKKQFNKKKKNTKKTVTNEKVLFKELESLE